MKTIRHAVDVNCKSTGGNQYDSDIKGEAGVSPSAEMTFPVYRLLSFFLILCNGNGRSFSIL